MRFEDVPVGSMIVSKGDSLKTPWVWIKTSNDLTDNCFVVTRGKYSGSRPLCYDTHIADNPVEIVEPTGWTPKKEPTRIEDLDFGTRFKFAEDGLNLTTAYWVKTKVSGSKSERHYQNYDKSGYVCCASDNFEVEVVG